MKKWVLMDEWLFQVYAHKDSGKVKVAAPRVRKREREHARRVAQQIKMQFKNRTAH
jgi:hypothetical protein